MNVFESAGASVQAEEPPREDDFLPMSGLQHLLYCPRQCALIHLEGCWRENVHTVEGRFLHERVDTPGTARRSDVRVARRVWLRSDRLRLVGIADVVEFHRTAPGVSPGSAAIEVPFPVEYKRGARKQSNADKVQLCAQAMALEESAGIAVPSGALFYGRTQRRLEVVFDEALRALTKQTTAAFHQLIAEERTPPAVNDARCPDCSLREVCQPLATSGRAEATRYLNNLWKTGREEPP
ncbi:MAG: CRISPR-associated protein Cas4 [Candidatus Wallbacteria bacterium]|nr:CRISPR-associated protein Cas4 [Candidatus Wallbacteria bacterium]